ncbi:hypothetical protein KKA69_05280, partial [Patescibacteria group bacterium]|nr:hypothetical protein [Patescibacteria group bacterium]
FLGRPAQFADNSFRLAQLTNASFLPTFIVRQPDLRLRVVIEAPIRPTEDDHAISYELMLRQFLDLAERYFEAYPCHYCRRLWVMHRQKPHLTHPLFNDGP